ncbi:ATP-binding Cassette (ABC) Superfamily [Thraustotheca clavata]|uniref:ATP-binding Cassette (ABC) Superfamily n=1 Tax=Thraustotheca clavata TaxID=74557 RepID=A0A1W0A5H9_9STRA|nr:ATP-binding Cassette (ABC) Superfamily [Thraustotheca clavata]
MAGEVPIAAEADNYVSVATPRANAALEVTEKAPDKAKMVPLSRLFHYAERTDYLLMICGTFCAIGTGLSQPLQIIFFGDILNSFHPSTSNNTNVSDDMRSGINSVALKFVWIGIGVIVCGFGQVACWSIAASRQGKRLKYEYIRAILRQEIGWFDVNKPMELATKVADTSLIIQDGMGRKVGDGINFFSMGLSGIIIGIVKGWKLALALLAFTPFIALTAFFMVKTLSTAIQMGITAYASAGGVAEESLSNIKTVQMFNAMEKFVQKYDVSLLATEKAGIRKGIAIGVGTGVMFGTIFFTYGFGMWFGAVQVADDQLTQPTCTSDCYDGGRVLTVFFAIIMGAMALGQSGPSIQAVFSARTAAVEVFNMIERHSKVDPLDESGKCLPSVNGEIKLENIEFYYPARPDVQVCKGYSLQIKAGEKVALVGPSGSGKSTIVSLLERYYDPTNGTVYLDGHDLKSLNVKWLRQQVGLVGQEPSLFSVSIAENIRHGREGATIEEVYDAAKKANAYDFIMSFPNGFDTEVGERGAQLSGGQKQRIAIARAIIKNPAILLLDEATSALDTESERVVQESLDSLLATRKRTTIIIAHRLSTIRDADRIIVLEKGSVVEEGSHSVLMEKPDGHYRRLVEVQSQKDKGIDTEEVEKLEAPDRLASSKSTKHISSNGIDEPTLLSPTASSAVSTKDDDKLYNVPMSRIWKLSGPEIGYGIIGSLGAVVNGAIFPVWGVLLTKVTVLFFNYTLSADEMKTQASHWALGFVGLGVAFCLSVVTQNYGFAVVAERLTHRLRYMGFKAMLHQDVGWFDSDANSSGALTTRLATDTAMIMAMTSETLNRGLVNIATLGVAFGIGFYYSWQMTLAMLGIFPILGAASYVQMQMMSGHGKKLNEGDTKAGALLTEAINSVRTVASFTMEGNVHKTYLGHLGASAATDVKTGLGGGIGFGVSQGVMFFAIAFLFWFGGYLIVNGYTTFESMFMVMMAIMLSSFGVGMAAQNMTDANKAKRAASSLFETIDRTPPIDCASTNGDILTTVHGKIELRNVHFAYPSRPHAKIYENYNLVIPSGSTVALVGASGCGKSTAISLIERFYDPIEGTVFLDGVDIKTLNLQWLRTHISLVGQEPVLFAGTIADNIATGKEGATRHDVEQAAKKANAHDFIMQFPDNYDTQVGDRGVQVSGGQKQRIAIARAILRDPEVLLLDEATSALDNESERIVQASLDKLLQLKKRTTIIVAHRLTTIQNADMIAVASNGRIAEKGTHSELMRIPNGIYASLVSRQMNQGH